MIDRLRSLPGALGRSLRGRGPQRVVLVAAGVVILLGAVLGWFLVTGDGGGDDDVDVAEPAPTTEAPPTTPSTTTVPETTTTTLSEEDRVTRAYEEALDAAFAASAPPQPDPDAPVLHEHFTGDELDERVAGIEILVNNGTALRFPEDSVFSVEVESVSFDEVDGTEVAYLDACTVTDVEEIALATGNPLPYRQGVWTVETTNTLERVDGGWKVADFEQHERHEGIAACAQD